MKLLLAEDTQDLNNAVTAILKHEGYEVDSVFDGESALMLISESGYDGIILDIMMPKKDGLEVLTELRSRHILTPVLLLTAKTEIDDRVAGLDAGADDYLPKPFAMKELLARIRSMVRRSSVFNTEVMRFGDAVLDPSDLSLSSRNSVRLSAKEFELMQALISGGGNVLSTKLILERVWRNEQDAGDDTVRLYISYLRGKLSSVGSCMSIEKTPNDSYILTGAANAGGGTDG